MSISHSSTAGFAHPSPRASVLQSHLGSGGDGGGGGYTNGSSLSSPSNGSSASFKKTFAVSSLKSLNRRQNYVLVLEFEKNCVSFHKVRRGKEVKRSFPFHACVKLERELKNTCQLTTTFGVGSEGKYKKSLFFANTEERELFCNLVHAMIVSGNRAVKLFKSLQSQNAMSHGGDGSEATLPAGMNGLSDESIPSMDFCEFLISFSSAQTQLSHLSQSDDSHAPAGSPSAGPRPSTAGLSFADEVHNGGRARSNAKDSQAAIMALLTENSANGDQAINELATSNLISLLNGRLLDGEQLIKSSDITYRVECSCGGVGQIVTFKHQRHNNNENESSQTVANSSSSILSASSFFQSASQPSNHSATSGANGNVEISSKDGTSITASSRGLFLLTNYRILYINYNENNSYTMHEASTNYEKYMHGLTGITPSSLSTVVDLNAVNGNDSSSSSSSSTSSLYPHTSSSMCTCDADIPLGLISKVGKSSSRSSDGLCEVKLYLKDGRKIEFGFGDCTAKWIEGLLTSIQQLAFPKDQTKLFAFQYAYKDSNSSGGSSSSRPNSSPSYGLSPFQSSTPAINGWDLYDALQDYTRVTLAADPKYRVNGLNVDYKLCASYPPFFVTPASIRDDEIRHIASYRSSNRLPAVVWIHPITRSTLSRCAQPLVGIKGKRSEYDEKLVAVLRTTNPSNSNVLHFFDARPWKAAMGNAAMGKGFENISHYEKATLSFMDIDNIHAIRNSHDRLKEVCGFSDAPVPPPSTSWNSSSNKTPPAPTTSNYLTSCSSASQAFDDAFLSKLEGTLWLRYVRLVLAAAQKIAVAMSEEGASCITHCSDGSG